MFHSRPLHLLLASLITFMAFACAVTERDLLLTQVELIKKAKAIHERVIVLDTHSDLSPRNFTSERNYTQRLDTQVNLPKMFEGGLDAVFFSVFVSQTRESQSPDVFTRVGYDRAYKAAVEKFDAIHWLTGQLATDKIELALTSADVRRIKAKEKKLRSSASRTAIRWVRTSAGSRNFTSVVRVICLWRTTLTINSPIPMRASVTGGNGTVFHRWETGDR